MIKILRRFALVVSESASAFNPSLIANYCYELAKEYNQYYHDFTILGEPDKAIRNFRLVLSAKTAEVIAKSMWLMGIEMPERM